MELGWVFGISNWQCDILFLCLVIGFIDWLFMIIKSFGLNKKSKWRIEYDDYQDEISRKNKLGFFPVLGGSKDEWWKYGDGEVGYFVIECK